MPDRAIYKSDLYGRTWRSVRNAIEKVSCFLCHEGFFLGRGGARHIVHKMKYMSHEDLCPRIHLLELIDIL